MGVSAVEHHYCQGQRQSIYPPYDDTGQYAEQNAIRHAYSPKYSIRHGSSADTVPQGISAFIRFIETQYVVVAGHNMKLFSPCDNESVMSARNRYTCFILHILLALCSYRQCTSNRLIVSPLATAPIPIGNNREQLKTKIANS